MKIWEFINDLLFPRMCLLCGAEGAWLCLSCRLQLTEEADPTPQANPKLPIFSLLRYEHRTQHLVHGFKYDGLHELATPLAKIMSTSVERIAAQKPAPLLVPVPMSTKRLRERGSNHAELLAAAIAEATGIPMAIAATKSIHTVQQVGLTRSEREKNLQNAFLWDAGVSVANRDCIIIDDVCTTGSTIAAVATALQKGHPASLSGLTFAYEPLTSA